MHAQAMLDIEYIMAIGQGVASQFWSTNGSQPHNPEVPRAGRASFAPPRPNRVRGGSGVQNEPFLVWLENVSNDPK
jgi:hypothetical protein